MLGPRQFRRGLSKLVELDESDELDEPVEALEFEPDLGRLSVR